MAKRDNSAPAKATARDKEIFKNLSFCGGVKPEFPPLPAKKAGAAAKKTGGTKKK